MTFDQLKELAFGRISVEELSVNLVQELGEVSVHEAGLLVNAAKESLETAMKAGDEALQAEIERIDAIIGGEGEESIAEQIKAIKGRLDGVEGRLNIVEPKVTTLEGQMKVAQEDIEGLKTSDVTLQGNIDKVDSKLTAHMTAYTTKVGELVAEDQRLQGAIDDLKAAVSDKNSNTAVFSTMEEFHAAELSPKMGDLAFVLDIKKAFIYKGEEKQSLDLPTPPMGWVYFDEISTEVDLAAYAKTVDVEAGLDLVRGEFAEADSVLEGMIGDEVARATGAEKVLDDAIKAEVTRAKEEETKIRSEFATADTALEGKINTAKTELTTEIGKVDAKVVKEIADREAEITRVEGLVSAEETRAKGVEAGLQKAIDEEVVARKSAVEQAVISANEYTDAEIVKVNGASEALAGRVDVLEGDMTTLKGGKEVEGSIDNKIETVRAALEAVDTGLRTDLTKAQEDILVNVGEIAKLEARRFILTRSQDVVTTDGNVETVHQLPTLANLPANVLIDVHVNSVLMHKDDYVLDRKGTIKFNKAYAAGKQVAVVYTYNVMA